MTENHDQSPNHQQPVTSATSDRNSGSFVIAAIFTGALFIAVLYARPRLDHFYEDCGLVLPALTNDLRSPFFLGLLGLLFGLTIFKEFLLKKRATCDACNTVVVVAALVLGTLYVIGMLLPLMVTVEKFSGD